MPGAMARIKINGRVRVVQQCVGRIVNETYPAIGIRLTTIGWHQGESIRLEDDNRFIVTQPCDETANPGFVSITCWSATGRVLRAVAARNVVNNQYRNCALVGRTLNGAPNILLHGLGSTAGEPDRLRHPYHLLDEFSIFLITTGCEVSDLFNRTVIWLGNVELGVGIEAPAIRLGLCQHGGRDNQCY